MAVLAPRAVWRPGLVVVRPTAADGGWFPLFTGPEVGWTEHYTFLGENSPLGWGSELAFVRKADFARGFDDLLPEHGMDAARFPLVHRAATAATVVLVDGLHGLPDPAYRFCGMFDVKEHGGDRDRFFGFNFELTGPGLRLGGYLYELRDALAEATEERDAPWLRHGSFLLQHVVAAATGGALTPDGMLLACLLRGHASALPGLPWMAPAPRSREGQLVQWETRLRQILDAVADLEVEASVLAAAIERGEDRVPLYGTALRVAVPPLPELPGGSYRAVSGPVRFDLPYLDPHSGEGQRAWRAGLSHDPALPAPRTWMLRAIVVLVAAVIVVLFLVCDRSDPSSPPTPPPGAPAEARDAAPPTLEQLRRDIDDAERFLRESGRGGR